MTLTVIGPVATRTFRVLWCLEELGLTYEHQVERPHSEAVNALNPLKQVPILKDGDAVLTDSTAILYYLSDRAGGLTWPAGTPDRARMDARIMFLLTELEAPLWMTSRHSYVLPETMRHPEIFPVLETDLRIAERKFARLLGTAPFFGGNAFSIADIIAAHCLNWATNTVHGLKDPAALAYLARTKERPAWGVARKGS
jgi:glutathione S-transferase